MGKPQQGDTVPDNLQLNDAEWLIERIVDICHADASNPLSIKLRKLIRLWTDSDYPIDRKTGIAILKQLD